MSAPRQESLPSVLWVILFCSVAFAVTPVINSIRRPESNKDYSLWYGIGQVVRDDGPLYQLGPKGEVAYMYPPTAAVLFFAPLTALGPVAFVVVLVVGTALSWAGCVYLSIRAATGRWRGHPRWYYLLTVVLGGLYVYDLFLLGQVNLFLLFLVLMAMELLRHQRSWLAGTCLGLAIAIKVFPLPLLVYWAVRREERAILATIFAVGVFVVVLPGAVRGVGRNSEEVRQWFGLMVGDQSGNTMAARSSTGFTRRNQSLVSVAHRLTRDLDSGEHVRVNVVNLSPQASQLIGLAAVGVLGLVLLAATRCRFAPTPEADAQETAMVLILVVLSSPLAWTYFFCWLLPAWAVALHACRTRRWAILPTVFSGFLLVLAFTEQFDPRLQACGVTAWGGVGLYLTLAAVRFRRTTPDDSTARGSS
jgi:hypothetical protein